MPATRLPRLVALCLLPSILSPAASAQIDRVNGRAFATRSEVILQHGMAATSHPLATQIAIDVLQAGGSATDAAIAGRCGTGADGAGG